MEKIGVGLIGAGEIAQNFHLKTLAASKGVQLLAISDKIQIKSKYIAEKYGIPFISPNINDILDIKGIDAVIISTPTDAHAEQAVKALEAGKHVFIEKPIARTLKEAKYIMEKEKQSAGSIMIGMAQRFRQDTIMLKNFVHQGDIGEIFYINAGWLQQKRGQEWLVHKEKSGGGVLLDLGISLIDSLMWIYDFQSVKSVRSNIFRNNSDSVEDVCIATLYFDNGSIATIEASWSLFRAKNTFYCYVYGDKGSASVNPVQLYKKEGNQYNEFPVHADKSKLEIMRNSFESEIKHFIKVAKGIIPAHSTSSEAVEIMKILEALYKSAEEKREISLSEID